MIKKSFTLVLQILRKCKAHPVNLVCEKNTAIKAICFQTFDSDKYLVTRDGISVAPSLLVTISSCRNKQVDR